MILYLFTVFNIYNLTIILAMFFLQVRTVKVSNVSLGASERDIKEFFSFSGDIEYVEMRRLVWSTFLCFFPEHTLCS